MMTGVVVVHSCLSTFGQVNYPFSPVGHALSVILSIIAGALFLRIERQTWDGETSHLWLARGGLLICCLLLLVGIIGSPMIFMAAVALFLGQEGGWQRWVALGTGILCILGFLLLSLYFLDYWPDRVALAIMIWFPGLILYVLSRLRARRGDLPRLHERAVRVVPGLSHNAWSGPGCRPPCVVQLSPVDLLRDAARLLGHDQGGNLSSRRPQYFRDHRRHPDRRDWPDRSALARRAVALGNAPPRPARSRRSHGVPHHGADRHPMSGRSSVRLALADN